MQSIQLTSSLAAAAAVLLLLLLLAPLVSTSSCKWDWLLYKDSCYAYYNQSAFWYDGEMTCKEQGGHLVSIVDDHENRLVGKLSLCKSVWIGRYAKDLVRLTEPAGYAWTDDKVAPGAGFSRHNFSNEASIHKPLIRSEKLSWYNALYHEQHPFVCKSPIASSSTDKPDCPSRMKFFQGNCYLFSGFEVSFIEANYYCQNHSTNLVSILSEQELHFLNTLDLSTDACEIRSVWLGLVKLSPCNPDGEGRELCYKWTDFSGKHRDFPRWAEGQPTASEGGESGEQRQHSCVTLSGDNLIGSACSERHAFICKAAAGSLTGDAFKALDGLPVVQKGIEGFAENETFNQTSISNAEAATNGSSIGTVGTLGEQATLATNELPKPMENEIAPRPEEPPKEPSGAEPSPKPEEPPKEPSGAEPSPKPEEPPKEPSGAEPSPKPEEPPKEPSGAEPSPKPEEPPKEPSGAEPSPKPEEPPKEPSGMEPSQKVAESGQTSEPSSRTSNNSTANAIHSSVKPRKDAEERMPWGLDELVNFDWQKAAGKME